MGVKKILLLIICSLFVLTCEDKKEDETTSTTIFVKTFGASSDDYAYSIQQTTDGGYIIVGYTNSYGNGGSDVWLIKTDSDGDTTWTKTFGGSGSEGGNSVQQTTDGGYINWV